MPTINGFFLAARLEPARSFTNRETGEISTRDARTLVTVWDNSASVALDVEAALGSALPHHKQGDALSVPVAIRAFNSRNGVQVVYAEVLSLAAASGSPSGGAAELRERTLSSASAPAAKAS